MSCEICAIHHYASEACHAYTHDPNGLDRTHYYCEKHFLEFCKMIVDEQ